MYDCLDTLVGISLDDTCIPEGTTSESISGLWLDDTSKGRVPLKPAFWAKMTEVERIVPDAVNEAMRRLIIATDYRLRRKYGSINAKIGFANNYTSSISTAGSGWRYLVIRPKNIKGSTITIKDVQIFTLSGKVTEFKVFKGSTEIVDYVPGYTTLFDENIYITYQAVSKPLNFKHTTCCGNVATHDGYSYVGSGEVADTANLTWAANDYCMGIQAAVEFTCDPFSLMCAVNYQKTAFGIVFAKLVQQIARLNIIAYIMTNDNMTPYLIAKGEDLAIITEYLTQDVDKMLNYLPEAYDMTDCYLCDGQYKGEILI